MTEIISTTLSSYSQLLTPSSWLTAKSDVERDKSTTDHIQRSQSDVLLLVLGLLAELPQLHQATHDLTELHPPHLRTVEVGQIPEISNRITLTVTNDKEDIRSDCIELFIDKSSIIKCCHCSKYVVDLLYLCRKSI